MWSPPRGASCQPQLMSKTQGDAPCPWVRSGSWQSAEESPLLLSRLSAHFQPLFPPCRAPSPCPPSLRPRLHSTAGSAPASSWARASTAASPSWEPAPQGTRHALVCDFESHLRCVCVCVCLVSHPDLMLIPTSGSGVSLTPLRLDGSCLRAWLHSFPRAGG